MKSLSKNGFCVVSLSVMLMGSSACMRSLPKSSPGTKAPGVGQKKGTAEPGVEPISEAPSAGSLNSDPNASPAPVIDAKVVGDTCHQDYASDQICLALKYVVYEDTNGNSVLGRNQAVQNVRRINSVWNQCNIAFQIDQFQSAEPSRYGLQFNTEDLNDLHTVRRTFQNDSTLLVVTTGRWNRAGTLGNTGANAWTSMPGEGVYGVVMESPVGGFANIIGHELGHYLSLDHYNDASDLMNPIIYDSSTQLTSSQCQAARSAVYSYWRRMIR